MSFFCLKKVYIKNICLKTPLLHTDGKIKGCADTAPLFFGRERNRASGIPGRFLFMLPVVVILFSFLCGCGTRSPQPVLEPVNGTLAEEEEPSDKSPDNPEDASGKEPASASNTGGQEKDDSRRTLTVHVCGAVKKEGVYSLPEGSRIRDAIEAAGGFDKDADTSFLNLAMKLEDSWQIRVPTVGEAEAARRAAAAKTEKRRELFFPRQTWTVRESPAALSVGRTPLERMLRAAAVPPKSAGSISTQLLSRN